jgi:phosphoserine aminotransferase
MNRLTTFNPGPSTLYPFVQELMNDAFTSGILESSHRSSDFIQMYFDTREHIHLRLNLPRDYQVYFLGSATEAWNVVCEGYVSRKSIHFYSGDFGRKWFEYAKKIHPESVGISFDPNCLPNETIVSDADLIALTQNETSNGSRVGCDTIAQYKKRYPHAIVAVDATSSMAGIELDFSVGDLWFASVQKCFGLPSGLCVLFASPQAVEKMNVVSFRNRYNSALAIHQMALKGQTVFTPNILGLFLLNGVLRRIENISSVHKRIVNRAEEAYRKITFQPYVNSPICRSHTVLTYRCENPEKVMNTMMIKYRIRIGNGYGELKESTFRVANFPACDDETFYNLIHQLNNLS